MSAGIHPIVFVTLAERDAGVYEEGDVCYVKEDHTLYVYEDDDDWHALARAEDLP